MPVDDWFWDWIYRHMGRFPRPDWPTAEKEFWRELAHEFAASGVTEAVADEASRRMFLLPPDFVTEHPPALVAHVKAIRREDAARAAANAPAPARTSAEDSEGNRDCAAHWATLAEAQRDEWRALVRERFPEFRRFPSWLEGLAIGWSFDPTMVAGFPPKPRALPKGVQGVTFIPKGS